LAGITVQVNGLSAPVEAVTPGQINAQLPQNVYAVSPTMTVTVGFADGTTLTQPAAIASTAPALIANLGGGANQAAAFHAGTTVFADANHPAVAGEVLETYGFGLGATTPFVQAGAPAPFSPLAQTRGTVIRIDGTPAQITYAGLVPGLAEVYQVNVVVPVGLAPGAHSMQWTTSDPVAGGASNIYTK
jgi:uncharacterized protein (TIGR03437 family)